MGLLHQAQAPVHGHGHPSDSNVALTHVKSNVSTLASKTLLFNDADDVRKCYEEETARLRRQVRDKMIVGGTAIVAKAAGAAASGIPFFGGPVSAAAEGHDGHGY